MHASPISSPSRSRSSIANGAASGGIFIESVHLAAPSGPSGRSGRSASGLGTGLQELNARLQSQHQAPEADPNPNELMVYDDDALPPHKPPRVRTYSRGVGIQADEREIEAQADRRPSVRRDARPNRERNRNSQRRARRGQGSDYMNMYQHGHLGRESDAHSGDSRDSLRVRMEEVRWVARAASLHRAPQTNDDEAHALPYTSIHVKILGRP